MGINNFGSNVFPESRSWTIWETTLHCNSNFVFNAGTTIGSTAASQGAFTGIFQNRWMPSANAIWTHGKHTITFGGSYSYTQLNARDERTNSGMIGFTNFDDFLTGSPITYTADGFITTTFLQGDANRYYRSNETGMYLQDKFQIRPNLSFSAGTPIRLSRRSEGKKRPHFQFRSVAVQLRRCLGHNHVERLHRRRQQSGLSHQGSQRFDSDGTAMGHSRRASAWPGARESSTTKLWFARAGACTTTAANSSPTSRPASRRASSLAVHSV